MLRRIKQPLVSRFMQKAIGRTRVWFSGRVQGVGFRYKARQIAQGYDVSGTVENLDDGRVLLCVQGEKPQREAFIKELKLVMADFIRKCDETEDEVSFRYSGFEIIA